LRNWALCFGKKLNKKFPLLWQGSYRKSIIIFAVFAGKTCSVVSPLPQDFCANYGVAPFTGEAPHDDFMQSVFSVWNAHAVSFMLQWRFVRSVHDRTTQQAPVCD